MITVLLLAAFVAIILVSIRQAAFGNHLLQSSIGSKVAVEGVIQSDPILKQARMVGSFKSPSQFSCLFKLTQINGVKVDLPLRLRFSSDQNLLLDQRITGEVKLIPSKERKVAAMAIAIESMQITAEPRNLFKLTTKIRNDFRQVARNDAAGALIPGLVLGDTSLQSDEFTQQMRRVGLSHLTAVSGANFAMVAAFLFWILQFLLTKLKTRLVVVIILLILFIFLVRPTPSVLRAAVMTGVILSAKYFGQRSFGVSSLAAAVCFLILLDPIQATDPGFALSVLATAGILLLTPKIQLGLRKYLKSDLITQAIAIPLGATVFCLPVIVLLSNQFSLVSIPSNILVAPVIAPITILGFIAAIFSPVIPTLSSVFLLVATPFSSWIVLVSKFMSTWPVITFNQVGYFLLIFGLFVLGFIKRNKVFIAFLMVFITSQVLLGIFSWPGKDWHVVNCDVGQGDGLVINLGNSSAIVIDVGPDDGKMNHCLNRLKIKSIPLLILTHFHADHVGALSSVISHRELGKVWISNLAEPVSSYQQVMKILDGIQVEQVEQGDIFRLPNHGVEIRVLWPQRSVAQIPKLPGDGSVVNNSSVGVIIDTGKLKIFAAGDTEPGAQELIANSKLITQVDILKVSHHGSQYQYLPLLDQLRPKVALISVGEENSYGHPSSEFIAQLRKRGITVFRTDKSGGISLATPNKIMVSGKEWWQIGWD